MPLMLSAGTSIDMKSNFAQQWLEILCGMIPQTNAAIFVVPVSGSNTKQMHSLAKWPLKHDHFDDFTRIVEYALKKQEQVCIAKVQNNVEQAKEVEQYVDYFALPLYLNNKLLGVIVVKVKHLPISHQDEIFNKLQQGTQWLKLAHSNQYSDDSKDEFYSSVVGLLASCFEQDSYQQGVIRLVTELTQKFNCERVAFADFKSPHCHVIALSNKVDFDTRSSRIQKIADAMDEAIEQDCSIIFPQAKARIIQRAHQDLSAKFDGASIITIPLIQEHLVFGAITLIRDKEKPFEKETRLLCQQAFALITPFLALKRDDERSLFQKNSATLKKRLNSFFGFKHLKLKFLATLATLLLLLSSLIEGDFRVTSDAILEGKIQRVVAAPIEGYLLSASVRAGDTVHQGELMATLDDAELQLELTRLSGQLQQSRREYREALSDRNLVKVRVITAQINQAKAEMALTRQQLKKIRMTAPFDGVVIEGDLSQMLGSPVERGDTLFKIAPLEGYRIIIKVDERLISYVRKGQTGILALSSIPEHKFPLLIDKITAVASADDGANIFRVEAALEETPALLRPGMQGIAKIDVGQARLLWIWTHEMMDWLRLKVWSWWP